MNPILMAALISGGINALQGKRGSDLLKSTIRDTAIAYALGPAGTGAEQTASTGISNMANQAVAQQTAGQAGKMTVKQIGQEAVKTQAAQLSQTAAQQAAEELAREQITQPSFLEKTFSAIEKPFLKPGTQDISKFRVGLGAAALGGGAYAAGLFDPKKAPDPKYAGYNRFYAADPSMFDPLSSNYGPDVSKYPEGAPYSGLQEGGIADLENMQSPDDMMLAQQQTMDDGPGIVASLYERFREGLEDSPAAGMMNMNFQQNKMSDLMKETSMPSEINLPERIKKEFVLKFKSDPDKTAIEYAVTMGNKDRITITDVQKAKQVLEKLTNEVQLTPDEISNVMGIAPADGSNIRIPEPANEPEAIRQLVDTFRAKASNEPAQPQFQQGDLVDVLPSKYKKNENDESNYKRTSGKLVTDETGKGSGNKDTMLAQLADGEFVTKAKSVLGAGKAMGGKTKEEQRKLGAKFFYSQMAELEKLAEAS
jgi:hypothetical protein